MAGGPLAQEIPCFECLGEAVVSRATRLYEGVEDDRYECERGHTFGVDYRRGPATAATWPLTPEQIAEVEAIASDRPNEWLAPRSFSTEARSRGGKIRFDSAPPPDHVKGNTGRR